MANPNTKIIIQEVDDTLPRGAGAPSDIAYVPGLAVNTYSKKSDDGKSSTVYSTIKNTPVLCYTVAEFERAFGPKPYVFTTEDIAGAEANSISTTFQVGGYDRSYIYAKELLQAGLPVYYENISSEVDSVTNVITSSEISAFDCNADPIFPITETTKNSDLKINGSENGYTYTACEDRANKVETYKFEFTLPTPDKKGKSATDNTLYAGSYYMDVIFAKPDEDLTYEFTVTPQTPAEGATGWDTSYINVPKLKDQDGTAYVVTWPTADAQGGTDSALRTAFSTTKCVAELKLTYKGNSYGKEYPFTLVIVAGQTLGGAVTGGSINYFYENVDDAIKRLTDKNEYTVKYITSGGFPTYDIGTKKKDLFQTFLDVAAERGDAIALIDHLDRPDALHGDAESDSIFTKVNRDLAQAKNAEYGAMFTPWGTYSLGTVEDNIDAPAFMPASFGYLMCMASAIATSPNWLAMAGVTRGMVPGLQSLHTDTILSNVVAEDYQPKYGSDGKKVSINCITNIKPYGLCIWGNRTLQAMDPNGAKALNFLNTRNMVSDIKKLAYSTAKKLMFEQDSDTLWLRFKSGISPLLDQLVSGYGISGYKIIRGTTKYNGQALTRGEMAAVIKIFPIAPIEYFEITVVLADEDVQVG